MRTPKTEWLTALRQVDSGADLRWNPQVGRWEFLLTSADGKPRSQFWGWFYRVTRAGARQPLTPDPESGLYPFRDLDDAGMREALENLTKTFIANPYDGAGTTQREVLRRYRFNQEHTTKQYRAAGELFADMAADRSHRLRGALLIPVSADLERSP